MPRDIPRENFSRSTLGFSTICPKLGSCMAPRPARRHHLQESLTHPGPGTPGHSGGQDRWRVRHSRHPGYMDTWRVRDTLALMGYRTHGHMDAWRPTDTRALKASRTQATWRVRDTLALRKYMDTWRFKDTLALLGSRIQDKWKDTLALRGSRISGTFRDSGLMESLGTHGIQDPG